jgi:hypothetical protein
MPPDTEEQRQQPSFFPTPPLFRGSIFPKNSTPNLPPNDCQANSQQNSERNANHAIKDQQRGS